ncbi:BrnT family toxin [Thiomicrospira microaerophila]|uniref:BrnT family toxin n=1 Tax=Thiomicrospira microaerophila TaxID=406020 RepID=UPI00200EFBAC|nr:BrnT family toxin [Thiomicrospira microaerophila]UQB42264.1 BrnT family toxin [Thiomicrospira microaerophila]
MVSFEWDQQKADSNLLKHAITFEEAKTVFYDEFATLYEDEFASDEERFILLGRSSLSRLLVVVHCERGQHNEKIRIISARKATSKEKQFYRGNKK